VTSGKDLAQRIASNRLNRLHSDLVATRRAGSKGPLAPSIPSLGMPLYEHLVERTAKSQVACNNCHTLADITFNNPSVLLVCPECGRTLGEWATTTQCIADLTAFVAAPKSD
jgi:ribosomal protein S27E